MQLIFDKTGHDVHPCSLFGVPFHWMGKIIQWSRQKLLITSSQALVFKECSHKKEKTQDVWSTHWVSPVQLHHFLQPIPVFVQQWMNCETKNHCSTTLCHHWRRIRELHDDFPFPSARSWKIVAWNAFSIVKSCIWSIETKVQISQWTPMVNILIMTGAFHIESL